MDERKWRLRDLIWWPIETASLAKRAALPCLIFAGFGAFIWTVIAIGGFFSESSFGHWAVLWAVLWILVAWGLHRMRPEAAIAGFILSLIALINNWGGYRAIGEAFVVILYVQAIRGTFAYKHFSQA